MTLSGDACGRDHMATLPSSLATLHTNTNSTFDQSAPMASTSTTLSPVTTSQVINWLRKAIRQFILMLTFLLYIAGYCSFPLSFFYDQLCSSKNGLSSPSHMTLLKCVRNAAAGGKGQRMKVSCMATSIPADRVPDMGKRQLMNLLLLGAISLPSVGMLLPYTYFFVPPGSGGAGGGIVAKDALGNDVIATEWIKTHGPGDRTLTQGLKGDPTYLVVEKDKTLATYGINAVCTHLGCVVPWNKAENKFICPCHGSQYNNQGRVVRGPAPLSLALVHADVDEGKVVFVPWVETDFRTGENPWWA